MLAYVYSAALYCEDCGEGIIRELSGTAADPTHDNGERDESSYDSDLFPKGPYANGGGEADSPQHCDACGLFLENPLTPDGGDYVRERADEAAASYREESGEEEGSYDWGDVAYWSETNSQPVLGEWIRFYLQWGG